MQVSLRSLAAATTVGTFLAAASLVGCGTSPDRTGAALGASASPRAPGALCEVPATSSAGEEQWPEFGGGGQRADVGTGAAPRAGALHLEWKTPVLDGAVYAQPLVAGRCLLVATEDDSVYAFNASTGKLVWREHLASPVPGGDLPCGNISPSGITGTPVVDAAHQSLWTVVFTRGPSTPVHQVVELSLGSGRVLRRQDIAVPGRNPAAEQQRAALAFDHGRVYVPLGGLYGDCNNYVGAVVGINTTTAVKPTYWAVPTARGAAIWEPGGPAVLAGGDLLVTTGNGAARPGQPFDGSDAVVKLSAGLKMTSYFAPTDWAQLDVTDGDLSSTGPVLLPGGLAFQIGKSGVGYLLSQSRPGGVGGQVGSVPVCSGGAYGADAVSGETVYVPCTSGLVALRVEGHSLRVLWSSSAGGGGDAFYAGGRVWEETRDGALHEVSPSNGHQLATISLASPVTDFPWLLSLGRTLYASDGNSIAAYGGL